MTLESPVSHAEPLDAVHLEARLARLRAALDVCPAEVPASLAIPARQALDEVGERLALGVDHTVVALFGGTGSGTPAPVHSSRACPASETRAA